jgi:CDP-diacylglycerol---serine O-phosphatidyltransferase
VTDSDNEKREAPKGKIYLLPNLLTTISLFSGFYSIISSINGDYYTAAIAIIIAGVFDGLDGRVARMTGTTSHFGMEYDSLCDLVGFGVAPALLAYQWTLQPYGRYGWLAAFLYVATTALRLARFNTVHAKSSSKTFTGLPCPAAAAMISTSVLLYHFLDNTESVKQIVMFALDIKGILMLLIMYSLSYLMVSSHKYLSFKQPETTKSKAFHAMVAMVLIIIVIATEPQITLFLVTFGYIFSGPTMDLFYLLKKGKKLPHSEEFAG